MENPIKLIHKFNKEAGLIDQGYDDFRESSFQIEEALEPFLNSDQSLSLELYDNFTPKKLARAIMSEVFSCVSGYKPNEATDVDRLDKACDAVVFAVGSMAKLELNPQEITKALNVVMHANFAKLHMPRDEFGKLTKPDDFVGPEAELQKILDNRSSK